MAVDRFIVWERFHLLTVNNAIEVQIYLKPETSVAVRGSAANCRSGVDKCPRKDSLLERRN
jgi:hypothetical protein